MKNFSQFLQTLSKIFLTFCLKLFGEMSNLHSTCRWGIILRRRVFVENYRQTHMFESWAKLLLFYRKNSCRGCKTWIYITMGFFWRNNILEKCLFRSFLDSEQATSGLSSIYFNGVFRTAFYLNIKTSWWKKKHFFCWKEKQKFAFFRYRPKRFFDFWSKTSGHWAKNRQLFVGGNLAWSWKLQFTCPYKFL